MDRWMAVRFGFIWFYRGRTSAWHWFYRGGGVTVDRRNMPPRWGYNYFLVWFYKYFAPLALGMGRTSAE